MENFVFYYVLFREYDFAFSKMQTELSFARNFLNTAHEICLRESQTFLTDESQKELIKYKEDFNSQVKDFHEIHMTEEEWRLAIGLMCTLKEWICDIHFFELSETKQREVFLENPVDGYYQLINGQQSQ